MYAGSVCPLCALALFLPTIIHQVSANSTNSVTGYDTHISVDWVPCHFRQPASHPCLPRRLCRNLCGWALWRSQGTTWFPQRVRIPALMTNSGRLKSPSLFFCIGGHIQRNRRHDLTPSSRCRVHYLDFFQESYIIIRRSVLCRVVSTTAVPGRRQLIKSATIPSGIYPIIRECQSTPPCTRLISSPVHSQHCVSVLWLE